MYLTRTAGIETLSFLLLPVTHKGILPALRELKLWQNAERKGTNVGKCILPALRELKHDVPCVPAGYRAEMYLTRTAGIETPKSVYIGKTP